MGRSIAVLQGLAHVHASEPRESVNPVSGRDRSSTPVRAPTRPGDPGPDGGPPFWWGLEETGGSDHRRVRAVVPRRPLVKGCQCAQGWPTSTGRSVLRACRAALYLSRLSGRRCALCGSYRGAFLGTAVGSGGGGEPSNAGSVQPTRTVRRIRGNNRPRRNGRAPRCLEALQAPASTFWRSRNPWSMDTRLFSAALSSAAAACSLKPPSASPARPAAGSTGSRSDLGPRRVPEGAASARRPPRCLGGTPASRVSLNCRNSPPAKPPPGSPPARERRALEEGYPEPLCRKYNLSAIRRGRLQPNADEA